MICLHASIAVLALLKQNIWMKRTPDFFTYSAQVAGSGTDFYKLAHQFFNFTHIWLGSTGTLMHILTLLGLFKVDVDYGLTFFGHAILAPIIDIVGALLVFEAYYNAYTVSQDTNSSYQATALSLMSTI